MSYIEDVETEEGICRVYGYADSTLASNTLSNKNWYTSDQLNNRLGEDNPICRAIKTWQRKDLIRGKGKAIRQSKQQFE